MARVLVLNAGSSTLKASVLDGDDDRAIAGVTTELHGVDDARGALARAFAAIASAAPRDVAAVGHRVVHGGTRFVAAVRVDGAVLDGIRALAPLAPLHNPVAAAVIDAAVAAMPGTPQIAVFDTSFHASLAPEAYVYALPRAWSESWGYRRYGFHGISCAWSTERAAALLGRDARELGLVVAHLGAGCSVTAVWQGRSVATSMGMTPLEGLVMATRAGSVDPGVLLAAQREHGLDADALADVLEHGSGLLGLAGTADMRELLAAVATNADAALALAIFERAAAAGIAAAATALPRFDALVFTGGIGEHAAGVRARVVRRLRVVGLPAIGDDDVRTDAVLARGPVAVLRIETREDVVIAREARAQLG